MKSIALAGIGSLLALFAAQGGAPASAPARETRLRFVDLNETLAAYGKAKTQQEEYAKKFEAILSDLQRRAEDLNKEQRAIAVLDKNSEEYHRKNRELRAELVRLEEDKDFFGRESREQRAKILLGAYDDIRRVVSELARSKGYEAVFTVEKKESIDEPDLQDRLRESALRKVLYHAPELDITPEVIRLLNQ